MKLNEKNKSLEIQNEELQDSLRVVDQKYHKAKGKIRDLNESLRQVENESNIDHYF